MRFKWTLGLLLVSQLGIAQLALRPLSGSSTTESKGRLVRPNEIRNNTLPFWDDFSITESSVPDALRVWGSDTTKQWDTSLSDGVLVNATLAKNPPSYRAVTFDGLDADGLFHTKENRLTDELVSDIIDLSGYTEADDIYLSFYWQAGGNVEMPDEKDSLVLAFYNLSNGSWETIWSMNGLEVPHDSVFYQEAFKLESPYINDGFRFKFSAYGDQNGPVDAWHVDWIYLNSDRADDDLYYQGEVSLNSNILLLFSPFRSVPVHQVANMDLTTIPKITSMNLNPEPDNIGTAVNYIFNLLETNTGNTLATATGINEDLRTFFNQNPKVVGFENKIVFDELNIAPLSNLDSIVLIASVNTESTTNVDFLDDTEINLRVNDTIRTEYLLHDFYAFDDGTAEYAVGTNINGAKVVLEYWLEEQDTLTHIDIYFPNIDPVSGDKSLTLQVYKNLDNEPVRRQAITINPATEINAFTRYELERPLILNGTFYVGYEQSANEYIGIGFDRSNSEAADYIYEFLNGEWLQNNRLQGAIMIRPVFKPAPQLLLRADDSLPTLSVYPNPTNGHISIEGDYVEVEVRNLSGQLLLREAKTGTHDISNLEPGLYLLSVKNNLSTKTFKILKK
ncbi:MAG: hypothetical protein Tsb0034_03300 [Ekhidna sp.]